MLFMAVGAGAVGALAYAGGVFAPSPEAERQARKQAVTKFVGDMMQEQVDASLSEAGGLAQLQALAGGAFGNAPGGMAPAFDVKTAAEVERVRRELDGRLKQMRADIPRDRAETQQLNNALERIPPHLTESREELEQRIFELQRLAQAKQDLVQRSSAVGWSMENMQRLLGEADALEGKGKSAPAAPETLDELEQMRRANGLR